MLNVIDMLERDLRRDMEDKNLEPYEEMIFDGQRHEYWVLVNGDYRVAYYAVTLYPFDVDPTGPTLFACYGFNDEKGKFYTYVSEK